jgi:hypothetical protein
VLLPQLSALLINLFIKICKCVFVGVKGLVRDKIFYNYLSEFDTIRVGNCERSLMKFI